MPMRGEIFLPAGPHLPQAAWDRSVVTLMDRDLLAVIGFCALGLLLTARYLHSSAGLDVFVASLGVN